VLENEHCRFLQEPQEVLVGSGIIFPREHRETVFDLTEEEWADTFVLLQEVKALLDAVHDPQGYNLGWNSGSVAGQEVFHAHLIERYGGPAGAIGLGVAGAVAINLCGGGMLLVWLVAGDLGIPVRGRIVLWAVAVVVLALGVVEGTSGSWREGGDGV
jgi:diadenosine tetraphosphate (Ap4A) HIT family hydrolase